MGEVGAAGEVSADTNEAAALVGPLVELVVGVRAARQLELVQEGAVEVEAAVESAEVPLAVCRGGCRSGRGGDRSRR